MERQVWFMVCSPKFVIFYDHSMCILVRFEMVFGSVQ
jgi:hypothetical protein